MDIWGEKKNKLWFIYAHHWESGEIAAYVWGKGIKTTQKLKKRIGQPGQFFASVWEGETRSRKEAYDGDDREGQLPRGVKYGGYFGKPVVFSNKLSNRWKAFGMAFLPQLRLHVSPVILCGSLPQNEIIMYAIHSYRYCRRKMLGLKYIADVSKRQ
ncbi:MAG: hypothetical protein LBK73_12810 [Treponema sp.]|nr:hypothetical protein [Treponema sp.]